MMESSIMNDITWRASFQIICLYPVSLMWIPYRSPIKCVEGTDDCLQASDISKLLFYFHINLSHSYTRGHLNTTFIADQVIGTGTGSNFGWGGGERWGDEEG